MIHAPETIQARGFVQLGEPQRDMPGIGRLQRVACDAGIETAGVAAFRTAPDEWRIYRRPGEWRQYQSERMIP